MIVIISLPEIISADIPQRPEMAEGGPAYKRFVDAYDSAQHWTVLSIRAQPQNKMNVIGHHHKFIQGNGWKALRKRIPYLFHNSTHGGHHEVWFAPIQT